MSVYFSGNVFYGVSLDQGSDKSANDNMMQLRT